MKGNLLCHNSRIDKKFKGDLPCQEQTNKSEIFARTQEEAKKQVRSAFVISQEQTQKGKGYHLPCNNSEIDKIVREIYLVITQEQTKYMTGLNGIETALRIL